MRVVLGAVGCVVASMCACSDGAGGTGAGGSGGQSSAGGASAGAAQGGASTGRGGAGVGGDATSVGGSAVGGGGTGGSSTGGSSTGGSGTGGSAAGGNGTGGAGGGGLGFLSNASYDAVMVFPNHPVVYTPTGLAWDGSSFWVGGDGNLGGFTEVRYDGTGQYVASYQPGIGFSSIYTKGDGTGPVFGRELTWNNVEQQTSPGQWSAPYTLAGGNPLTMTAIVWDADHSEHIGLMDGTLHRWNATGQSLPNIQFQGYGTMSGESTYPRGRRVVWAYGHYFTYAGPIISAWDAAGTRVATATLNGAGTTDFDSYLSFSFAQGKVWVLDSSQGSWRGYDIAP
jgi:hypothetical protein